MTRLAIVSALTLLAAVSAGAQPAEETFTEEIETQIEARLAAGASYLRGLPDGARVRLVAPDGSARDFELREGSLHPTGYRAEVRERVLHTPGGYRFSIEQIIRERRVNLVVTAPRGSVTRFYFVPTAIVATEVDGGVWTHGSEVLRAYLPDGTRVDFDRAADAIQVEVAGEAWRMTTIGFDATDEPSPLANAIRPAAVYQTGDGDDWSLLRNTDLLPIAWSEGRAPIPVEELLQVLSDGDREPWVRSILARLAPSADGAETAAYLLAAGFSLPPGSRIEVQAPRRETALTFVLPGTLDIPRVGIMAYRGRPMADGG